MNRDSYEQFSFKEMKNLALKNDKQIQEELKWLSKFSDISDITPSLSQEVFSVEKHGINVEQFLSDEINNLENNFEDLKNNLNLETVCFMNEYNFKSEQTDLSLSLLDRKTQQGNQDSKKNKNNTTKIIINKLDI